MKLIFYFEQAKDKMAIQGDTHYQSNPKEGIRMQRIKVWFPIFQCSAVFIHSPFNKVPKHNNLWQNSINWGKGVPSYLNGMHKLAPQI